MCFFLLFLFRFRFQHKNTEHPEPGIDSAFQVLLPLLTCSLQQRPRDQLLVLVFCPGWDGRCDPPSARPSHSLQTVENPPLRPHRSPPWPHPPADLLPPFDQPAVPLRTRLPPLVQPGLGPQAVEHYPANRRAASCRPCHQGPHPPAVPRHPEHLSDPGDGGGQWLQEAHWPGSARGGPVLPRATPPGGCRLL